VSEVSESQGDRSLEPPETPSPLDIDAAAAKAGSAASLHAEFETIDSVGGGDTATDALSKVIAGDEAPARDESAVEQDEPHALESGDAEQDDSWIPTDASALPDDLTSPYHLGTKFDFTFAKEDADGWVKALHRDRLLVVHALEDRVMYAAAEVIARDVRWACSDRRVLYVTSRDNDLDLHEVARRSASSLGLERLIVVFDGHSDYSLLLSNNYAPERITALLRKLTRWNLSVLVCTRDSTLKLATEQHDIQALLEFGTQASLDYIEPRLRFRRLDDHSELHGRIKACIRFWGDSPKEVADALDRSFREGTFLQDLTEREDAAKDPTTEHRFRSRSSAIAISNLVEEARSVDPYLGLTTLWTAAFLPDLPVEDFEKVVLTGLEAWGESREWIQDSLRTWRLEWRKLVEACRLHISSTSRSGPTVGFPQDTDAVRILEVLRVEYRFDHLRLLTSLVTSGLLIRESSALSSRIAGAMGQLAFLEPDDFGRGLVIKLLSGAAGKPMHGAQIDKDFGRSSGQETRRRILEAIGRVIRSLIKKGGHEQAVSWLRSTSKRGGCHTAVQIFFLSAPENFTVIAQSTFLLHVVDQCSGKPRDVCMDRVLRLLSGENALEVLDLIHGKVGERAAGMIICSMLESALSSDSDEAWGVLRHPTAPDSGTSMTAIFSRAISRSAVRARAAELASGWFSPASSSCLWKAVFFSPPVRKSMGEATPTCLQSFELGVRPGASSTLHAGDRLGAILLVSIATTDAVKVHSPEILERMIGDGFQPSALSASLQELKQAVQQTAKVTSTALSGGSFAAMVRPLQRRWTDLIAAIDHLDSSLRVKLNRS
jgi:hypothetical protein